MNFLVINVMHYARLMTGSMRLKADATAVAE